MGSLLSVMSREWGFPGGTDSKQSACKAEPWVQSLGQEDPLGKGMATHSRILAWRIPWTEEPGGLQFMGSLRIEHMTEQLTHRHTQPSTLYPINVNDCYYCCGGNSL